VSDLKDKTWLELCEAASREYDPEKLLELITALNDELELMEWAERAQRTRTMVREELFRHHEGSIGGPDAARYGVDPY